MTENDRRKFAESFFGLQEYFGKNHSKAIIELYFKSLQDLTIDEFQEACIKAIRKCRFFPKIVELRKFADDSAVQDRPLLAWLKFRETMKVIGASSFDTNRFSDPVIPRVIRMLGGMERIRMWAENELPFRQKDFLEYYDLASRYDALDLLPFIPKENSRNKNLLPCGFTIAIEDKSQLVTGNRSVSVTRKMEIKTSTPPVSPKSQIRKLIRHLIDEGEDVSSLRMAHPEIYRDVINENREGYGNPGA